jgi:hypothetical protein
MFQLNLTLVTSAETIRQGGRRVKYDYEIISGALPFARGTSTHQDVSGRDSYRQAGLALKLGPYLDPAHCVVGDVQAAPLESAVPRSP